MSGRLLWSLYILSIPKVIGQIWDDHGWSMIHDPWCSSMVASLQLGWSWGTTICLSSTVVITHSHLLQYVSSQPWELEEPPGNDCIGIMLVDHSSYWVALVCHNGCWIALVPTKKIMAEIKIIMNNHREQPWQSSHLLKPRHRWCSWVLW